MCTQYYVVYTCHDTKIASLEECATPSALACRSTKMLKSIKYVYVNHKCDFCRRASERNWRLKKQLAAMEREENKKKERESQKIEDRMLVDEVFKREVLAKRREEKQREREEEIQRLEAFGRRKRMDERWKLLQNKKEEEVAGPVIQSRGVMGGLGIFFGM